MYTYDLLGIAAIGDQTPKVVVTTADHPTGLGVARALRPLGFEVIGLTRRRDAWTCASRTWGSLVDVCGDDDDAYMRALLTVADTVEPPLVLFPTADSFVMFASRNRDTLRRHFSFVLPSDSTIQLLMDKTAFHRWAVDKGFPVPESHVATDDAELASVLADIQYPVVLKPLYRTVEWARVSPCHKVYKLQCKEDLRRIGFEPFRAAPSYLVQRWITGSDANVHFCLTYFDRGGSPVGHYTGRKLLQWPRETGSTALCSGTGEDSVWQLTEEVLRAAEFKGIGSVEMKYCETDKRYYITEPTVGRPNLQSYVAVAGGINLTAQAVMDALGHELPTQQAVPRRAVWLDEYSMLQVVRTAIRHGDVPLWKIATAAGLWRAGAAAYLQLKDPAPFLRMCRDVFWRRRSP